MSKPKKSEMPVAAATTCSARAALESAIRKCRIAQWEVFDACMDADTRKMMGDDLLTQMAELESNLDRAYDRMWKRLNSLPNVKCAPTGAVGRKMK